MSDERTTGTADRLSAAVAQRAGERVEFLQELVRTPSLTGDEGKIQDRLASAFERAALDVRRQQLDPERIAKFLPSVAGSDLSSRPNVIGVLPGSGGGRSLLLNAHVDTVLPGDVARWTHPPFSGALVDGEVWGVGACDMKAGLVACLYALVAIRDADIALRGDVVLAATVGEESGGAGAIAYALDVAPADAAIVTEPTGLAIAPAHAGAAQWRVTLEGRAAHACLRNVGVSAIEKFVSLHGFLHAYERERIASVEHALFATVANPVPLNVGIVHGGDWAIAVPDRVTVEGRLGMVPGEDIDAVCEDFATQIETWADGDQWLREHRPRLEWPGVRFAPSEVSPSHELVKGALAAFEATQGRSAEVKGMTYGTDMTHFNRIAGIPTILFGPGDMALAHRNDERVPVDQLHAATSVLARTATQWCA